MVSLASAVREENRQGVVLIRLTNIGLSMENNIYEYILCLCKWKVKMHIPGTKDFEHLIIMFAGNKFWLITQDEHISELANFDFFIIEVSSECNFAFHRLSELDRTMVFVDLLIYKSTI
jgi:hypothetical protein